MHNFSILLNINLHTWLISNLMHKILIYLHIIYLLKSSTCFEHYPDHLQVVYVVIVYMQPLVSSLSAGD
jgi:peptidoglycan/LPS O-acetylase OafA/YrhL